MYILLQHYYYYATNLMYSFNSLTGFQYAMITHIDKLEVGSIN